METDDALCLICKNPFARGARRYRRAGGHIHFECDERRKGFDLVVRRVLGHRPNAAGGCTLFLEGELGGTIRTSRNLTLPMSAEMTAVKTLLDTRA